MMQGWRRTITIWVVLFALSGGLASTVALAAQIVSDRPGYAEAPQVVPQGAVQIETELLTSTERTDGNEKSALGMTLKYGLAPKWDAQLQIGPLIHFTPTQEHQNPWTVVRIKHEFLSDADREIALGLMLLGGTDWSRGNYSSTQNLLAFAMPGELNVSSQLSLSGMWQSAWLKSYGEGGDIQEREHSFALGLNYSWNDRWSGFIEGVTWSKNVVAFRLLQWGIGALFFPTKNQQWDIGYYRGLDPEHFRGQLFLGYSVLLP